MTISSTINRVSYSGNGVTTAFAVSFPFHAKADLVVVSTVVATGVETVKALTTHYTISGTTDALGHYPNGGTVTFIVAPASTERITIYRDPAKTQGLDLQDASSFPAESVEAQYDYETMLIQRVSDLVGRSLRQPDGDSSAASTIPAAVVRANKYLAFDSNSDPIAVDAATASGTSVLATGSTTARLLADRFAEQFHVADYGAVGDGATNDTVAIQAAIDAAGTAGGGTVVFGPKTYLVATTLTIGADNITLAGVPGVSTIKASASLADGTSLLQTTLVTGTLDVYQYANLALDGIIFDGNSRTLTAQIGLIRFGKTDRLMVRNCLVKDHQYIGMSLLGCRDFKILDNEFTNWGRPTVTAEGGAALYVGPAGDNTTSKSGSVQRNYFHDSEWSAFYFFGQQCDFCFNTVRDTKEGIYLRTYDVTPSTGAQKSLIFGNRIYGTTVKNIQGAGMEVGGWNVVVSHNDVERCDGAGIDIADVCDSVSVVDNQVRDCVRDTATFPSYGQITVRATNVTALRPISIQVRGNRVGDTNITPLAPAGIAIRSIGVSQASNPLILRDNDVTNGAASAANNIVIESAANGAESITEGNISSTSFAPYVGTATLTAAVATQAITGVGFKPRLVEIYAARDSATMATASHGARARTSVGASCTFTYADGTVGRGGIVAGKIINLVDSTGAVLFDAGITSFDNDGFTVDKTTASIAAVITYVCHP